MQRVRVYHLNENGHWDDKGTGVIKVETAEVRHALGIRCRAPWAGDQGDGSSVCTLKLVCTSASPRPHRRPMLPPQHPTSDVHLIIEDDTDASRLLNHTVTQGTSYQRQKGARFGMYGRAGRSEGCRHVRRPPVHPCMWLGCCDRGQCDCGWHTSVQTLFVRAAFASYKQLLQRRPAPHSADDSIISWTEASSGIEIALSFQEAFTCTQVWAEIQSVQDAGLSPRAQAAKLQGACVGVQEGGSLSSGHSTVPLCRFTLGPGLPMASCPPAATWS